MDDPGEVTHEIPYATIPRIAPLPHRIQHKIPSAADQARRTASPVSVHWRDPAESFEPTHRRRWNVPDHVHLLASLGRTLAVADAVRLIKSNSSGWIHDVLGLADFCWQDGYGAFAVSYSNIDQVKSYLANQEQHHRRVSFQEEFLELLRRHDLEWDERYVWD
jgi:hypothetical protein